MPEGDDPCTATIDVLRTIHERLWRYRATISDDPTVLYECSYLDDGFGAFALGLRSGLENALGEIKSAALLVERNGIQQSLGILAGSSPPGAGTASTYAISALSPAAATEPPGSTATPTGNASSSPSSSQLSLSPELSEHTSTTRPAAERRSA